jgi:hypothetical protein
MTNFTEMRSDTIRSKYTHTLERLDLNLLAIFKFLAKATSNGSLVDYNPLAALVSLVDSVKV